jgi:hypothetical protein
MASLMSFKHDVIRSAMVVGVVVFVVNIQEWIVADPWMGSGAVVYKVQWILERLKPPYVVRQRYAAGISRWMPENSTVLVTTLNNVVVASVAVAVTEIGTVMITMIEVGIGIEVGRDENQM